MSIETDGRPNSLVGRRSNECHGWLRLSVHRVCLSRYRQGMGIAQTALGVVLSMELSGWASVYASSAAWPIGIGSRPTLLGCLVVMAVGMFGQ